MKIEVNVEKGAVEVHQNDTPVLGEIRDALQGIRDEQRALREEFEQLKADSDTIKKLAAQVKRNRTVFEGAKEALQDATTDTQE